MTGVKSPFIIITSVECPFFKPRIPLPHHGTPGQEGLSSNDSKVLSLQANWGENKVANKLLVKLSQQCVAFLQLKCNFMQTMYPRMQVSLCFFRFLFEILYASVLS